MLRIGSGGDDNPPNSRFAVPRKVSHNEDAVRSTNDDASISKLSAVSFGYYKDDFIKYFVHARAQKKDPLMNRGYWSRVEIITLLISRFLSSASLGQRKQIVSLGAGFDTTFFRMKARGAAPSVYVEVDYAQVTQQKISIIAKQKELRAHISPDTELQTDQKALHSPQYHLVSCDLRSVGDLERVCTECNLDRSAPTLFLSECVLIYLEPEHGDAVIQWAATHFQTSAFVTYEQIHPNDSFGAVMLRNLETRGCTLRSIKMYPDLEAQRQRYLKAGWQVVEGKDMNSIFAHVLDPKERGRISRLELFDELEEWHIMQSHYCTIWAFQSKNSSASAWAGLGFPETKKFPVADSVS